MKTYKAIFFDWDGTAVMSRRAPADEAVRAMKPLLQKGIKLVIVSGTTIENIAGGDIAAYFTPEELRHLYLGLGRGAYNYAFDEEGRPFVFSHRIPEKEELLKIHRISYDIHAELLGTYDFPTDIVFSRPNYCKIDLMVARQRGDSLFMQASELDQLKESLSEHQIEGGLQALLDLSVRIGTQYGVKTAPTCDAKYLEVGISSKSDNVDTILGKLMEEEGIEPSQCCYWGDEYVGIEPGIYGSDSFMKTELSSPGDFFDVSELDGDRPEGVTRKCGGVEQFLRFLSEQCCG